MAARFAWVLNLDADVELAAIASGAAGAYSPKRSLVEAMRAFVPRLAASLLDEDVRLAPLSKSDRNPYQNFIFVGRASTCDVILRDASVSKTHAVFERDGQQPLWKLRDNRSHNGTWVNHALSLIHI